jgi:exosortase A
MRRTMHKFFSTPMARMALVVVLVAAVVMIFRDSFSSMFGLWSLSSYQHAYIVPPMSLLLLWMVRREFTAEPLRGSIMGLVLLAALAVLWLGARASAVQAVEHIAIVGMVIALVLAVVGWPAFRTIAFPVLFLLAAVPIGEELTPVLMRATADVSERLLGILGVPTLREGMFFTLPGGNFEVAEICAGLRYLMAGTVTALLFAYLNFNRWGKRIAFTLVAAVSFVVANGVRAFITMLVASATNGRLLGGQDHIYFGMVLFAVLLVALLWFGMKLADPAPPKREYPPADASRFRPAHVAGYATVAFALLGAAAALQAAHESSGATLLEARLPALDGCAGPEQWSAPWQPELVGADVETRASYRCGSLQLHVYLASYGHQEQGKELISAQNHLVPFDWRQYTRQRARTLEISPGVTVDVNETRVATTGRNVLAVHWYDVNGRPSQTRSRTKLNEALQALDPVGVVSSVRMVAVSSEGDDFDAMRALLESHVRTLWPLLAEEPRRRDGP